MRHGGDLSEAIAQYGGALRDWLDLSTGINPEPWPIDTRLLAEASQRLPTQAQEHALIDAAREAYRAPDGVSIVPLPGVQAAIQWLPQLACEGGVAIVGPTYSEHAYSWRRSGRVVMEISSNDALPQNIRHAVIVNPNNPDGSHFDQARIIGLAEAIRQRNGWLIIDESFADIDTTIAGAPLCTDLPIIVLRSFGKFFGLPGLRLGFLIAAPRIAAPFREALGPWPVSTPALVIGAAALADRAWADATRIALANMARQLDEVLVTGGLAIAGGTGLFRFTHCRDAKGLHRKLALRHIWCRRFDEYDDRLRFGLPRSQQDLARLKDALESI